MNLFLSFALLLVHLPVQVSPRSPSFDVASIKPNNTNNGMVSINNDPGGRFVVSGFTLKALIAYAYRIRDFQISGGPGWLSTDRFDIEAKAELDSAAKLPQDQLALMLQRLLAERFQLRMHKETKELPVYELTIAKGGSRLESVAEPTKAQPGSPPEMPPAPGAMPGPGSFSMGFGTMRGSAVALSRLIENLGPQVQRVVIDKTDLAGYFNIRLNWTPDGLRDRVPAGSGPVMVNGISFDPNGPSLFTALQEQLGLKLEPGKGPVDVWVVDAVEKPSQN